MENASKALIIAGAILIAIMIVSLGVLIFTKMSSSAKQAANMDEQEIANFNSKITPYIGENISGSQVNALLQYCLSSNMQAKKNGETNKYIKVTGDTALNEDSNTINRVQTGKKYYKVKGTYDDNGLLTTINITENTD